MKITEINLTIKNLIITAAVLAVLYAAYKTRDIIVIFLIAVLIAYLLNPLVNFFERMHIRRPLGVLILVLLTGAAIFLLLALILPAAIEDVVYFVNNVPQYIGDLFSFTERVLDYFGMEMSLESIRTYVTERIGMISKYTLNTLSAAAASVKGIVLVLLNVVLIPVLVFFLLKDFPRVKKAAGAVVERLRLQKVVDHLLEFEHLIGRYFRGIFLVALVLSTLYTLALMIIGVKGAVFLGVLTGMGNMIPYFGFAIGIIASVITAAVQYHDFIHPLYVVVGYVIIQVLESTVITPKIVGDSMGLNPVLVIFALMIGGSLFGLFGMILALPVAAFIKIMLNKYFFTGAKREEKTDKRRNKPGLPDKRGE